MSSWGGKRDGQGRKPKYGDEKTVSRSYTVPESLDWEIRRRAENNGKSASEVVVETLRRAFRLKTKETSNDDRHDPGAS